MIIEYTDQYQELADIFDRAVHETATSHYSQEQIDAWAPRPIDLKSWQKRCNVKQPFVYVSEDKPVAFLELDPDGHIDCHYVHPHYSRRGIGSELLEYALEKIVQSQLSRAYVEASHLAKGLYLKHGFKIVRENQVLKDGVVLTNWLMQKSVKRI
mgnify:CR=1 FL=1